MCSNSRGFFLDAVKRKYGGWCRQSLMCMCLNHDIKFSSDIYFDMFFAKQIYFKIYVGTSVLTILQLCDMKF